MRPARPLLALGVLALLAGCLGLSVEPLAVPEPVPPLRFGTPLAMPAVEGSGSASGFEPSVAVDGNGVVYLTAPLDGGTAIRRSGLWVSADEGGSFTAVPLVSGASASNLPLGLEGHVDANAEGRAYFVDLTLASITLASSRDGGASWDFGTPAAALVPGGDREWVAAGAGDKVYVVWNQIPSGFWIMASEDGGRTFPVQTPFRGTGMADDTTGLGPGWTYAGVPAVGPDGAVYVARGESDGPAVYVSKDGARTFARTLAWTPEGPVGWLFTTVTTDAAGTVYVSTVEQKAGGTRVVYAYSKDGGATFSAPRQVTDAPGVHAMQWGAAGPDGVFAVAFYENPEGSGVPDESVGEWRVRVVRVEAADTDAPVFRESRPTERVVHEGTVCTGGLGNCEGNSRDLGDYLGVDVGPDGSVHVTWIESATEGSPVMYARAP